MKSAEHDEEEEEDDQFFNDPLLHAQLDQVENQFIIDSQINTNSSPQPTPAKRIKLSHHPNQATIHSPTRQQDSIQSLEHHIQQIKQALSESNAEKVRLKGEVSLIRSKLDSQRTLADRQIQDLKQTQAQFRLKAQQTEKELIRLKNQKDLKETFKGLEESSKKSAPTSSNPNSSARLQHLHPQPSPSPKLPRHHQNLLFNHQQQQKSSRLTEPNKLNSSHLNPDFNFHHQSTAPSSSSSPNKLNQSNLQVDPRNLQKPQEQSIRDKNATSVQPDDDDQSSSPLYPSSYSNTLHHLNKLNSQIENLQLHPPCPNELTNQRNKLVDLVLIHLFQSFLVNLNHDQEREIQPISMLQTILTATHQQRSQTSLNSAEALKSKRLERLVFDLFICLSRAFGKQEEIEPSFDHYYDKDKRFKNKFPLASTFGVSQRHHRVIHDNSIVDQDIHYQLDLDERFVLRFVTELGSIFVQITHLLSQTDLLDAKSNSIELLNILAQSSPLFTSYFLNHPDFSEFHDAGNFNLALDSSIARSNLYPRNNYQLKKDSNVLSILMEYMNQVVSFFDSQQAPTKIKSKGEVKNSTNQSISKGQRDDTHDSTEEEEEKKRRDGVFLIHLACLNFLELIFWDPPEVCYPTLADFLKSDQVLRFFLIENQPEINLEKSLNILTAITSRMEFSKIILTSQIPVAHQSQPASNPNQNSTSNNLAQRQSNNSSNHRAVTMRLNTSLEHRREGERESNEESNEERQVSVIERLMKILILTLNHQINTYQYPSQRSPHGDKENKNYSQALDEDHHQIKVKILNLIYLLGIKNSLVQHDQPSSPSSTNHTHPNGFLFISQSCKFLFSVLVKLIFVDSYLLWNFDGSIFHKLLIPKCIERIGLTIEILNKIVFNNNIHQSDTSGSPVEQEKSININLMDRLKEEHMATCHNISRFNSNKNDDNNNHSKCPIAMIMMNNNNIYHEFVLCFSKLSFSDLTNTTNHTNNTNNHTRSNQYLLGILNKDQIVKLDNIGDAAYDLLQSVASMDELDVWRLASMDEEEDEEEEEEDQHPDLDSDEN